MDIVEGLKYPMNDKNWVKKIIIGGILCIIPIVNFVVFGYIVDTIKYVVNGQKNIPEWENWGNKFIKGLCCYIIYLVYVIIPTILCIIGLSMYDMGADNIILSLIGLSCAVIAMVVAFIIGFILPMAIANYAVKDRISAAFEFNEIIHRIKSVAGSYILSWVVCIGLFMIIGIVVLIPIVGWIIYIFMAFYIYLVMAYYFGTLYVESSN